jgi:hypothetical protein
MILSKNKAVAIKPLLIWVGFDTTNQTATWQPKNAAGLRK